MVLTLSLASLSATHAGSATWNANPVDNDWNNPANWTPATVPNGPNDVATFGVSNTTAVTVSGFIEINSIVFTGGASAFTISPNPGIALTVSGAGITNNSGIIQNFVTFGDSQGSSLIAFTGSASAGGGTSFSVNAGAVSGSFGGSLQFLGSSSAGNAMIVNRAGQIASVDPGHTTFDDTSSAGTATIINEGSQSISSGGGGTDFMGRASAANATLIANGEGGIVTVGMIFFYDRSTAANATVIANGAVSSNQAGGLVSMGVGNAGNATLIANGGTNGGLGGRIAIGAVGSVGSNTAQVKLYGDGTLSITSDPDVMVGSLEGDGIVNILCDNNLSVGNNNLSTTFSGAIKDYICAGGALTKIGTGTLTLSGASTYTGGTVINGGTLKVANTSGSGTGIGSVEVNAGNLGGKGIIAGAVTVGTGSGAGAFLAPGAGARKTNSLTIQGALTIKADGTYSYRVKTKRTEADQVIANGVTIESGAQFSFKQLANKKLTAGTVFTALENTSANPIIGTFTNLPDDATFVVGDNTYQADYQGGDGNDLTLTVVP
jgi:autotransporter-associated beta strand protein